MLLLIMTIAVIGLTAAAGFSTSDRRPLNPTGGPYWFFAIGCGPRRMARSHATSVQSFLVQSTRFRPASTVFVRLIIFRFCRQHPETIDLRTTFLLFFVVCSAVNDVSVILLYRRLQRKPPPWRPRRPSCTARTWASTTSSTSTKYSLSCHPKKSAF